jgi:hypothetical protein
MGRRAVAAELLNSSSENSRLRRVVTDLLLEKIKLEEAAQRQKFRRDGTRRASR